LQAVAAMEAGLPASIHSYIIGPNLDLLHC